MRETTASYLVAWAALPAAIFVCMPSNLKGKSAYLLALLDIFVFACQEGKDRTRDILPLGANISIFWDKI
jgi:hypothetical protein